MAEPDRELSRELHDATLVKTGHDEPGKIARLTFRTADAVVVVTITGLTKLNSRRDEPWGPSDQVNTVVRIDAPNSANLEVEMQSGDVIDVAGADLRIDRTPR